MGDSDEESRRRDGEALAAKEASPDGTAGSSFESSPTHLLVAHASTGNRDDNPYKLHLALPDGKASKVSPKWVELSLGLPIYSMGEFRPSAVSNSAGRQEVMLAGYPLAYPTDREVVRIRQQSNTDLVTPRLDEDLSDRITRAIVYLYRTPQHREMQLALDTLREYINTVENAILGWCRTPKSLSACLHIEIVSNEGQRQFAPQRLTGPTLAHTAKRLSDFIFHEDDVITPNHLQVLQLIMSGAITPGSTVAGLRAFGKKEADGTNVYMTLDDLDRLDKILNSENPTQSILALIVGNEADKIDGDALDDLKDKEEVLQDGGNHKILLLSSS